MKRSYSLLFVNIGMDPVLLLKTWYISPFTKGVFRKGINQIYIYIPGTSIGFRTRSGICDWGKQKIILMDMTDKNNEFQENYKLIADTIRAYPLQIKQAWEEIKSIYIPEEYQNVENVILCGMGGSALGGRIIDALIQERLRVPFEIYTEYHVPNYVNEKTLVIASSYSGNTEETINATYEALNKGAKVFGAVTGGKLAEIFKENKIPSYVFNPKHNPSDQPRMGLGYACGIILSLLTKLKLIQVLEEEVEEAVNKMNELLTEYNENSPSHKNLAFSYAQKLKDKIPVFIASEHLVGAAYSNKNQINENSKTFALLFDIPELNHHLLEGLIHPAKIRHLIQFIFIKSDLYSERVLKRYPITQDVMEKNGFDVHVYSPSSEKKLTQVFETLIFGSMTSYYLARDYKLNIVEIPWVDYFKEKMSK